MANVGMNIFHFFLLLIKEVRKDKKLNKIYLGTEIQFIGTRVVIYLHRSVVKGLQVCAMHPLGICKISKIF
jgi:hypothetical protein